MGRHPQGDSKSQNLRSGLRKRSERRWCSFCVQVYDSWGLLGSLGKQTKNQSRGWIFVSEDVGASIFGGLAKLWPCCGSARRPKRLGPNFHPFGIRFGCSPFCSAWFHLTVFHVGPFLDVHPFTLANGPFSTQFDLVSRAGITALAQAPCGGKEGTDRKEEKERRERYGYES